MKLLLITLTFIILNFSTSYSIEKKNCVTKLQKAKPACWEQLKLEKVKETKVMKKLKESHKNLEDKKKSFDEKNKTLWDMFKNKK